MEDFSFFSNNKVGGDIITFKYRYRKQIIIGISILLLIIIIIVFSVLSYQKEPEETEPLIIEEKKQKKDTKKLKEEKEEVVKVDIKGAINLPGIYSLTSSSRVIDVIEKAGGLTENADTSVINLSKKLTDEMVIIIYTKAEVRNFEETKEREATVQEKCNQKDQNALKNDACITTTPNKVSGKVSINTGTVEELMTLTGIGEAKAKDIITYREKNGPFKKIEDIKNVTGIGENIFAQIKENITL